MWDDIVIGKGEQRNCAMSGMHLPENVSENDQAYWVSKVFPDFDFTMRVYKSSPEGKQLSKFIKAKKSVCRYIQDIALKHATITQIKTIISLTRKNAYELGREDAQTDIKAALGLS